MRWRGFAFVALLALGGCPGGYVTEAPLYGSADGVAMLGDRGAIVFPSDIGAPRRIPFERRDTWYDLDFGMPADSTFIAVRVQAAFVPIVQTPEDDYVAQIRLTAERASDEASYYFFVLRTERGGLRLFGDVRDLKDEFEPHPSDALCRPNGRSNAECEFASRDDAVQYYLTYIREVLSRACDPDQCEAIVVAETAPR